MQVCDQLPDVVRVCDQLPDIVRVCDQLLDVVRVCDQLPDTVTPSQPVRTSDRKSMIHRSPRMALPSELSDELFQP